MRDNDPVGGAISVAMVTYNGNRFVREQLESILAQDPPPDEIVIGDDGSTDDTVAVIRLVAETSAVPVRLIEGNHLGLRRNVERTLVACGGDVIVLADQDDAWSPGKLRAVRSAFEVDEVTLWFSDAVLVDDEGRDLGERLWDAVSLPASARAAFERGEAVRRLLYGQSVTGATMAFRASLRDVVLPLPRQLELGEHLYLHDGWIAVLASLLGTVLTDPHPYVRYRRHPDQVTYRQEVEIARSPRGRAPRLVSRSALALERDRVVLVLDRLESTGFAERCRPADVATLRGLRELFTARAMRPGLAKWAAITRAMAAGHYTLYARGWRTAAADLIARRSVE